MVSASQPEFSRLFRTEDISYIMHSGICIRVVIEFILFYVIPAESPTLLIEPEPVVGVNTQSSYIRVETYMSFQFGQEVISYGRISH